MQPDPLSSADKAATPLEFNGSFAPSKPFILWRGLKVVVGYAAETPLSAVGFFILAIVLRVLLPPLAGCGFAIAIGTIGSKYIWKILVLFKVEAFNTLETKALTFQKNHPYVQAICIIASFALAILTTVGSILAGTFIGIFNGIIVEANHRFMIIEKKRGEEKENAKRMNQLFSC